MGVLGFAAVVLLKSERKYAWMKMSPAVAAAILAKPYAHWRSFENGPKLEILFKKYSSGHYQIDGPCISWEVKEICVTRVDENRRRGRTWYSTFKYDTLTFPRCCVYKGSSLGDELHEGHSSSGREGAVDKLSLLLDKGATKLCLSRIYMYACTAL